MPLGIDFTQIFLHLFNVVILFGGLYILLYAPVKKFMEERDAEYARRESETAENLKASEEKMAEIETRLADLDVEIADQKAEAAKALDEFKKTREKEARDSSAKIIRQAEQAAQLERKKILTGIKDDIENIVTTATEKVALKGTQAENLDLFLDEAERSITDAE